MHSAIFQFDEERRARVVDCLRKDRVKLGSADENLLIRNIDHSIQTFLTERGQSKATFRETHEALRVIWILAHEEDCPVGQLRAGISQLPQEAVDYMDRRARYVIPRRFPCQDVETGFLPWAAHASPEDLITAARVLSAEGGQLVSRSRGPGVRSSAKLEPRVLGQVRGVGDPSHRGGRPKRASQQDLIRWLAIDWTIATGKAPSPGRSDHTGFGDLVHSVFQWLEESAPDQALRRYWGEVERGRIQTAKKESERTGS
jgi:hypothetical protein